MIARGTLTDMDEAVVQLSEAFHCHTFGLSRGPDARGSCIHANEGSAGEADIQFMAPGRWLATANAHKAIEANVSALIAEVERLKGREREAQEIMSDKIDAWNVTGRVTAWLAGCAP